MTRCLFLRVWECGGHVALDHEHVAARKRVALYSVPPERRTSATANQGGGLGQHQLKIPSPVTRTNIEGAVLVGQVQSAEPAPRLWEV